MAEPGEHQPLWERRDMSDQERERQLAMASTMPAATGSRKRLPQWALILGVLFIFAGVMRAIVQLFGSAGTPPVPPLRLCVSASFGARTLGDLSRGFLVAEGAKSVGDAVDPRTGGHSFSAQLPGAPAPLNMALEEVDAATALDHLADHECQVAIVPREMTPLEIARFHTAPIANLIALDGAVVVVNPGSSVRTLTAEELRAIFSGEIRDWSAMSTGKAPIHLLLPYRGADEISLFTSRMLQGQLPSAHYDRSSEVALDVAGARALGAVGLTTFHHSDPARAVGIIEANGRVFAPSTLAIGRRTYPLTMPVYAYADEANLSNAAYQFLVYIGSADGQNVLVNDGFVSPAGF